MVIPWQPPSWFLVSCHVAFPANISEVKAFCVDKGRWHRDFKFFAGFSCYVTLIRESVTDFSQDVTLNSLLPDPNLWALNKIVSHPVEKLPESVLLLCTEGNSLPHVFTAFFSCRAEVCPWQLSSQENSPNTSQSEIWKQNRCFGLLKMYITYLLVIFCDV